MTASQVDAFLRSVTHKFSIEAGAVCQTLANINAITYSDSLSHPWPRAFTYRTEFFTESQDATAVSAEIATFFAGNVKEHVLSVFSHHSEEVELEYGRCGYQLAWSNILLGVQLGQNLPGRTAPLGQIRAATLADIDEINRMEPEVLSHAAAIEDAHIHEFVAEVDNAIVAKAQIVTIDEHIGYVSDMFVHASARQRGLGGQLLQHLHSQTEALGIGEVVLLPSLMTRKFGFYERFGYKPLIPMHLFICEPQKIS